MPRWIGPALASSTVNANWQHFRQFLTAGPSPFDQLKTLVWIEWQAKSLSNGSSTGGLPRELGPGDERQPHTRPVSAR